MKSYNKSFRAFAFAAIAAVSMFSVSCTQVDDTVGGNLLPGGSEHLSLHIDTLGLSQDQLIKVFQTHTDSIARNSTTLMRGSMNLNVGYLGSEVDATFGKTTAASLMTALPAVPSSPNFYKNRHKDIDSVKLILNMKYIGGNSDVKQTFNVYRLKDSLAYSTDTLYYHSIRYENHIDTDKPLFSFDYSGKPEKVEEVKMNVLASGREFLNEFMATDTTLFYTNKKTAEFLKKFKGFVIAAAPGSPESAAIYANYIPNTCINFYFQRERDQWEIDADKKNKEKTVTAFAQWYMNDKSTYTNTSVASIRHDFAGTSLAGVKNGGKVEAPEMAYVKGLGGVTATLEFGDGFFTAIDKLIPSEDYTIFVNQAHMFVWVKENSVEAYNRSFQKLGSYIKYSKMDVIADYFVTDKENDTTIVPYDGTLNRNSGKGYYEMDITSFMQHAIQNDNKISRQLTLAPTYTPYEPFADALTTIQTHGSENPVTVRLTYTLIKNDK